MYKKRTELHNFIYDEYDVPIVDESVAFGQRVRQNEPVGRAARRRGRGRVGGGAAPVGLLLVQYHFLRLAGQFEAHLEGRGFISGWIE